MERGLNTQARRALLQQIAPEYHNASACKKRQLLEGFVVATGYVRKYAMWLLNHAEEVLQTPQQAQCHYGPEVQQALVVVWQAANCICAKRLIPFLPTLVEALEQHGYLSLTEEIRSQLLSMSAATADRLLRTQRHVSPHGLSSTKAGPLLKQQIPIRTFARWDEAQPGFLEADLVAHCGGQLSGGCLYTLTLTDVATGWTECLPLFNRGQDAVLAAFQRARTRFPFPILGIDTDNGGEFINEEVAAYCAREQITFTRGRPYQKRDQCFVEQKNGVVVRQVVGYGRLVGEHAYQQLAELYRALRLYVNCFQPSMKLMTKQIEGRKIHRTYDVARTPLQRLLLSKVLTTSRQQELSAVAKALDPIHLFHQVEQLQQATFRCEVNGSSAVVQTPGTSLVMFELTGIAAELFPLEGRGADEKSIPPPDCQEPPKGLHVLGWRRTSKDPFAGQWEQILSWMQANPTRSSGDIFRQLQSLYPQRYHPLQIRTLQRGMRKIRTRLFTIREEQWQTEVIHGCPITATEPHQGEPAAESHVCLCSPVPVQPVDSSSGKTSERPVQCRVRGEESRGRKPREATRVAVQVGTSGRSQNQASQPLHASLSPVASLPTSPSVGDHSLTIEQAIESYLQEHRRAEHSPKTLEWHQTALSQMQQYLLAERHLVLVSQITETDVRDWFAFLQQTPTSAGKRRSACTIETYARSVRAFCNWLVHRGHIARTPLSERSFPWASASLPHFLQPEVFEQFTLACQCPEAKGIKAQHVAARDRAILWVLFDTGITVSELCALRLGDIDRQTGILRVRGKGDMERQIALRPKSLEHLLWYLDQSRPEKVAHLAGRRASEDSLFLSQSHRPLTKNSLELLFGRLRRRAGIDGTSISPQLLRHSFALRYLQAGGDPYGLRELLGYAGMGQVKQYLRWHDQLLDHRAQCMGESQN